MRAKFVRILLLSICVAMIAPLPGHVSTKAQEDEGGEGLVYCHCQTDDLSMRLVFPAAGGAVQGAYTSAYTVVGQSLLYAEDGLSDHYKEERTVEVSIQFGGSYSGGGTGVFSFQVTGTGSVHVDNLEDDRFDRSYRVELEATATGNRIADGNVRIWGIGAEFTPVVVDAIGVPNTRWLDPPPVPGQGEMTLACSISQPVGPTGAPQPLASMSSGGPSQPPGPVRAAGPSRPPRPPGPPPPPPAPPAPPPVPPPSGDCGPVQLVYLDDLGISPLEAEIDAFIENALAQGGPDLSLIISHRERLMDRFGQQGFQQTDELLRNIGSLAETCPFVLIVGNPEVVPFAVLPNPTDDGDVLYTDDVYGDNDHDSLTTPDIPVARIPDGYSLGLLLTQLSRSDVPAGGDFTLANSKRPHADGVASQVFGRDRSLFWSLPTRHTQFDPALVDVRYSYFMLHGASSDTAIWWGEEDIYPEAFTVAEADSQGIVLSGACYGAYTSSRTPQNSMSLAFLANGARAFVGATGITYSSIWPDGSQPAGPLRQDAAFQHAFLDALSTGQPPLAAFMEAKSQMEDLARSGTATSGELKMLHELLYYGKP